MTKTKLFSWFYDEMNPREKIDSQINRFVEENGVEIVDIKLTSYTDLLDSSIEALLIYK